MKTDKNNNLKSYIEECAENWLKASMSNLNSDLGIISNILSSFIILRSIEEDIHKVTDIRAHIKKLFRVY